jgi:hypothetical protein
MHIDALKRTVITTDLTEAEKDRFLQAVGETRQNLKRFHDYLKDLESVLSGGGTVDIHDVKKTVQDFVSVNKSLLMDWDHKPVFGNGVELRLQNEPCGLCATDGSARIILDLIDAGRLNDAIVDVKRSEQMLTGIYRGLSGNRSNPTMIEE